MTEGLENNTNVTKIATEANLSGDKSLIFSVKDLKANNFGPLFVESTVESMLRACQLTFIHGRGSMVEQFPADYMLYQVGYFDNVTGEILSTGVPMPIKSLLDVSIEVKEILKNRVVDIPQFMKGDENDNRNEDSSTSECVASAG